MCNCNFLERLIIFLVCIPQCAGQFRIAKLVPLPFVVPIVYTDPDSSILTKTHEILVPAVHITLNNLHAT
jgi:uncharacterized membrane protein YccF (DUF307 family)